jgi:hypothetical protein
LPKLNTRAKAPRAIAHLFFMRELSLNGRRALYYKGAAGCWRLDP